MPSSAKAPGHLSWAELTLSLFPPAPGCPPACPTVLKTAKITFVKFLCFQQFGNKEDNILITLELAQWGRAASLLGPEIKAKKLQHGDDVSGGAQCSMFMSVWM